MAACQYGGSDAVFVDTEHTYTFYACTGTKHTWFEGRDYCKFNYHGPTGGFGGLATFDSVAQYDRVTTYMNALSSGNELKFLESDDRYFMVGYYSGWKGHPNFFGEYNDMITGLYETYVAPASRGKTFGLWCAGEPANHNNSEPATVLHNSETRMCFGDVPASQLGAIMCRHRQANNFDSLTATATLEAPSLPYFKYYLHFGAGNQAKWLHAQHICYQKYGGFLAVFDHETEWTEVANWLQGVQDSSGQKLLRTTPRHPKFYFMDCGVGCGDNRFGGGLSDLVQIGYSKVFDPYVQAVQSGRPWMSPEWSFNSAMHEFPPWLANCPSRDPDISQHVVALAVYGEEDGGVQAVDVTQKDRLRAPTTGVPQERPFLCRQRLATPAAAFKWDGNHYWLSEVKRHWVDAEAYCVSQHGGHLASIVTQEEHNHVYDLKYSPNGMGVGGLIYLGISYNTEPDGSTESAWFADDFGKDAWLGYDDKRRPMIYSLYQSNMFNAVDHPASASYPYYYSQYWDTPITGVINNSGLSTIWSERTRVWRVAKAGTDTHDTSYGHDNEGPAAIEVKKFALCKVAAAEPPSPSATFETDLFQYFMYKDARTSLHQAHYNCHSRHGGVVVNWDNTREARRLEKWFRAEMTSEIWLGWTGEIWGDAGIYHALDGMDGWQHRIIGGFAWASNHPVVSNDLECLNLAMDMTVKTAYCNAEMAYACKKRKAVGVLMGGNRMYYKVDKRRTLTDSEAYCNAEFTNGHLASLYRGKPQAMMLIHKLQITPGFRFGLKRDSLDSADLWYQIAEGSSSPPDHAAWGWFVARGYPSDNARYCLCDTNNKPAAEPREVNTKNHALPFICMEDQINTVTVIVNGRPHAYHDVPTDSGTFGIAEAATFCRATYRDGNLWKILSQRAYYHIAEALGVGTYKLIVGLNDTAVEGTWEWADGTAMQAGISTGTWGLWASGEPNNAGNNEDCVHVYDNTDYSFTTRFEPVDKPPLLFDLPCAVDYATDTTDGNYLPCGFVCEGSRMSYTHEGVEYVLFDYVATWADAAELCSSLDASTGRLAAFESLDQQEAVKTALGVSVDHWIGLSDAAGSGSWSWAGVIADSSDTSATADSGNTYRRWTGGAAPTAAVKCAYAKYQQLVGNVDWYNEYTDGSPMGAWADADCTEERFFMCQYVPGPSSAPTTTGMTYAPTAFPTGSPTYIPSPPATLSGEDAKAPNEGVVIWNPPVIDPTTGFAIVTFSSQLAETDTHNIATCCWKPAAGDTDNYIEFDLQGPRYVLGAVVEAWDPSGDLASAAARCTKYTLKTRYGTRGGWILQGTFDVDYPRTMAHHYLNKSVATQFVRVTCTESTAAGVAMSAALVLGEANLENTLQSAGANGLSYNVSLGSYRLVVENVPELSFAPADTSTVVVRRFYSNDWDATYLSEFVAESKVFAPAKVSSVVGATNAWSPAANDYMYVDLQVPRLLVGVQVYAFGVETFAIKVSGDYHSTSLTASPTASPTATTTVTPTATPGDLDWAAPFRTLVGEYTVATANQSLAINYYFDLAAYTQYVYIEATAVTAGATTKLTMAPIVAKGSAQRPCCSVLESNDLWCNLRMEGLTPASACDSSC